MFDESDDPLIQPGVIPLHAAAADPIVLPAPSPLFADARGDARVGPNLFVHPGITEA